MLSLHQLRCFLATYEHGSLTAAAEELGYAQPSISEQVRGLEKTIGMPLFRRVGRGMVPTTVADTLRPHAERTLAEAAEALRVARSVSALETGTIRFGMFGSARLYTSTALVVEVLRRHPGVRVELVGQNSSDVLEDIRRGRIEAALIALPQVTSEGIEVTPVARDELVYVSADPERVHDPVSAARIGQAQLVMAETTWRDVDSTRVVLRQMLHAAGQNPRTRIEVEDIETADRAGRPRPRRQRGPPGGRREAPAPAGAEGRHGLPAAPAVRRHRHRAPRRRQPLRRRPADDRDRHPRDPRRRRARRSLAPRQPLAAVEHRVRRTGVEGGDRPHDPGEGQQRERADARG